MLQKIRKIHRDRVTAGRVKKYKTGEDRFNYINKKLSTSFSPFLELGYLDETRELFIESLKDDEIFSGLSSARGFQTALTLSYLNESTQENFNTLLRLHALRVQDASFPRFLKDPKIKGLHNVVLKYKAKEYLTEDSWCKLAIISSRAESQFMSDFIAIWDEVFSEKTKARVVEILEEDSSYCSVKNIYTLSIAGYNEEKSMIKKEDNREFSIFETPTEWIHFMLESPEKNYLKA